MNIRLRERVRVSLAAVVAMITLSGCVVLYVPLLAVGSLTSNVGIRNMERLKEFIPLSENLTSPKSRVTYFRESNEKLTEVSSNDAPYDAIEVECDGIIVRANGIKYWRSPEGDPVVIRADGTIRNESGASIEVLLFEPEVGLYRGGEWRPQQFSGAGIEIKGKAASGEEPEPRWVYFSDRPSLPEMRVGSGRVIVYPDSEAQYYIDFEFDARHPKQGRYTLALHNLGNKADYRYQFLAVP